MATSAGGFFNSCVLLMQEDDDERERWQAIEVLQHELSTQASDM